MGKFFLTVLVGAAVAGVVYYLYDREGAEKLMGNVKDATTDAFGKITDKFSKTQDQMSNQFS
jgi:hypothetical protein